MARRAVRDHADNRSLPPQRWRDRQLTVVRRAAASRCFSSHRHRCSRPGAASRVITTRCPLKRRRSPGARVFAVHEDLAKKNIEDIFAVFRHAAAPAMQAQSDRARWRRLDGWLWPDGAGGGRASSRQSDGSTDALGIGHPDARWKLAGQRRQPAADRIQHAQSYGDCRAGIDALSDSGACASIHRALAKARDWLLSAPAPSAEDRAMRLMGLVWTKAPAAAVKAAIQEIVERRTRREAGHSCPSWIQTPTRPACPLSHCMKRESPPRTKRTGRA